MNFRMHAACTVSLLAVFSALGCAGNTSAGDDRENVRQSSAPLSAYQWSSDYAAGSSHSDTSPSIATLTSQGQELTVMVHKVGYFSNTDNSLYFAFSYDGANWTDDAPVDGITSAFPPHLAAFNGYLYMVTIGESNRQVWMSRFNNATKRFDPAFALPFTSTESPALAAFNGSLYLIGTHPISGQVWQATMSTAEVFSSASDIPGLVSVFGTPSLTVHCAISPCFQPVLYMAYRVLGDAVTMSGLPSPTRTRFGSTTPTWWTPWSVVNTDNTIKKSSVTPAIVSYQNVLHMVYTDPATSDLIKWTYYDGSAWSTDVSIMSQRMQGSASLSARSNLLSMVHPSSVGSHNGGDTQVYAEYFQ